MSTGSRPSFLLAIVLVAGLLPSCAKERPVNSGPIEYNLYIANDKTGYIYILDPDTLSVRDSIRHSSFASFITPTSDGEAIIVQSWGEGISGRRRYDVRSKELEAFSPIGGLDRISFVVGDRWLLSRSYQPKLIDPLSLEEFTLAFDSLYLGDNLPGDTCLSAVVRGSRRIRRVNLATGEISGLFDAGDMNWIVTTHLHPDGRRVLVAGDAIRENRYGAILVVGDLLTGEKLFEWHQWSTVAPTSITPSADGRHCFVTSSGESGYDYNGYIDVYDIGEYRHLLRMYGGGDAPLYPAPVIPLPDGRTYVVATDWYQVSNTIQVFDLPTLSLSEKIEMGSADQFWVGAIAVGRRKD